jgi:thiamine kinase-like enzyme
MPDPLERKEEERVRDLLAGVPALADRELTIEPLGGGLTNRNYLVDADSEAYVVRVAGADTDLLGIDRAREVACARAAADAGVAPPIVAYLPQRTTIITRFVPGRLLKPAYIRKPRTLRRVAQVLRRCHDHPAPAEAAHFSPFATVRRYHALAEERHVPLPAGLGHALDVLARIDREVTTEEPPCLCHNDLLPANFIDDGRQLWIIDWEYAGRGDRFFDLGNFAVNCELDQKQEHALLEGYFGDVRPEHLRRLRLMRLASDMREAMWGYLQSAVSRLHEPDHYLSYAQTHVNRFLASSAGLV